MVHGRARSFVAWLSLSIPALLPTPAYAEATSWNKPDPWFVYTLVLIVLGGSLLALGFIRTALGGTQWSLADALSEDVEVTEQIKNEAGQLEAQKVTKMFASSSRLIALIGMIAILLMFLGFGSIALYSFANSGTLPTDLNKVISFLLAGMTLFAPYVVNKFSTIFSPK